MTNEEQLLRDIDADIHGLRQQRKKIQDQLLQDSPFKVGTEVRGTVKRNRNWTGRIGWVDCSSYGRIIFMVEWEKDENGIIMNTPMEERWKRETADSVILN